MPQDYRINLDERISPYDPDEFFCVCIQFSVPDPNAKQVYYLTGEDGKPIPIGIRTATFADQQETQYYKGKKAPNKTKGLYSFTAVLHEAKFYATSTHATQAMESLRQQFPDSNFLLKTVTLGIPNNDE